MAFIAKLLQIFGQKFHGNVPEVVFYQSYILANLGHMTKMASTPIYGKNLSKIFFSRTSWPIVMKFGM